MPSSPKKKKKCLYVQARKLRELKPEASSREWNQEIIPTVSFPRRRSFRVELITILLLGS